jgi:hypothetical protein
MIGMTDRPIAVKEDDWCDRQADSCEGIWCGLTDRHFAVKEDDKVWQTGTQLWINEMRTFAMKEDHWSDRQDFGCEWRSLIWQTGLWLWRKMMRTDRQAQSCEGRWWGRTHKPLPVKKDVEIGQTNSGEKKGYRHIVNTFWVRLYYWG